MNRLFLILVAVMFACTAKEEKTIITGTIDNPVTEKFEITYPKDLITGREEKHEIILDENNSFYLELDIRKPVVTQLQLRGEDPVILYIKPGDDLHISADGDDFKSSLSFAGKNADNNSFLFKYHKNLDNKYKQQQIFDKITSLEPAKFIEFVEEMLNSKKKFFNNKAENESISEDLINYMETEIVYEYYTYRLIYPMYVLSKSKWEELPKDYFDFLEDARSKMADNKLISSNYRSFVEHYLDYYKSENPDAAPDGLSNAETNIYIAEKLLDDKTLNHTKASLIYNEFYLGEFENAEKLYKSFVEDLKEEPCDNMANILTTTYENIQRTLPGNPAPDFELTDINGESVSLSDFRGKVVYLDFWASWCPPCMREVPYARELKERFKDEEDLVFLYISIDENPDAWRKTVKEREIKGVHLNVPGRYQEVPSSYNVRWIPTYYIIDRNGIIFENNAKRPSNESIDDDLKAALEIVS